MTKFSVRVHKTVYAPVNIEIEANTFKEAAILGLAALQQDYPNWTDRINDHNVIDLEIWNVGGPSPKKRTLTIGGRRRA